MHNFEQLIAAGAQQSVSDMHIAGGHPVVLRQNGTIKFMRQTVYTPRQLDTLAANLLGPRHLRQLKEQQSCDLAVTISGVRLRLNIFANARGLSMAIRFLPALVPDFDGLNLHPSLKNLGELHDGLILLCGGTGSGKSTTIAAILDLINDQRKAHIVTLEDPIEYRFVPKRSFIQQRELGTHFPSFAQGIRDVLRQDPDVILVGELREPDTIRLTLDAAESGHLVVGTLHASTPEEGLSRIVNSFPSDAQDSVRFQLSSCLACMIVQQLIYLEEHDTRVPMLSVMRGTQPIKALVREHKFSQIPSAMQMGRSDDMFTMESYKREFIDTLTEFRQPMKLDPQMAGKAHGEMYVSPLIDPEAAKAQQRAEQEATQHGTGTASAPVDTNAPDYPNGPDDGSIRFV